MRYVADHALMGDGLRENVLIEFDERGMIVAVTPDATRSGNARALHGVTLPGMPNAHSHAFQWGLGPATQRRPEGASSFWSWREQMYAAAASIEPDAYEDTAYAAFSRMRRAGYTSVAEFHYIHADPAGRPYARVTEMSDRLIAAARRAGIAITLLPVLYLHAGFGGEPLSAVQRRFSLGLAGFIDLWRALHAAYARDPDVRVGIAAHSLRAVTIAEFSEALDAIRAVDPGSPVHIHIAEQGAEVDACRVAHGTTPIAYLMDRLPVDERWCLVHATHASDGELRRIAAAGAVVALCPTTEADLGDGIFAVKAFLDLGGRIAIGSDSNVRISVSEELRLLEYAQRLRLQRRTVLCDERTPSVGDYLYRKALAGGVQALGRSASSIGPGWYAGAITAPLPRGLGPEQALDGFIFADGNEIVPVPARET